MHCILVLPKQLNEGALRTPEDRAHNYEANNQSLIEILMTGFGRTMILAMSKIRKLRNGL